MRECRADVRAVGGGRKGGRVVGRIGEVVGRGGDVGGGDEDEGEGAGLEDGGHGG